MIYYVLHWLSLSTSHGLSFSHYAPSIPRIQKTNKTETTIKTSLGFQFNTSHQKSISTYQETEFIPFLLFQMYSTLHANNNFISDIKT